jgi:hypothetical protein
MSSARKIYHIESEQISISKRITRALFALAIFIVATYAVHTFLRSSKTDRISREEFILDAVLAVGTDFFFGSKRRDYDVEVDDDVIRMRNGDWNDKSVRRGHIRYLREVTGNLFREGALRLSEHGPIRTHFLGCVWVPASLPEYEQIRAKARSWMAIE